MRRLGSLVVRVADEVRVPAGSALAVDRGLFARRMTEAIESLPRRRGSTAARSSGSPTTPSRSSRPGPLTVGRRWPHDVAAFVGRDAPALLRRGEPGRRGRLDRPREGLPRLALRQGRRRLPQLPARRGGVRAPSSRRSPRAECASVHDFEKELFFEGCLPVEVIASRGERHAALRADEAGRPRRPAHRQAAPRRRAAAPGQPRRQPLVDGRLPDPAQVGRAEARLPPDPRPRAGRVRALRHDPPQHLRERAAHPRAHLRDAAEEGALLRRADVRASRATSSRPPRASSPASRPRSARAARSRRPSPRTRPSARSAATSPAATPSTTSRRTSPSASCRSCPQRVRDKAKKRLALAHRALESLERFQAAARACPAPTAAAAGRLAGCGPSTAAFLRHLERERNASPAHDPGLRRGPRAVHRAPARASSAGSRAPRTSTTSLIRGFLAELHRRGLAQVVLRAQARGAAHLLPLPVPRGAARDEPGPHPRDAPQGEAHPVGPRRGAGRLAPRRARRRARGGARPRDPGAALRHRDPLRRARVARRRARWTSTRAWSACSARAARSAIVLFGHRAQEALRAWLPRAGAAAAEDGRPLPERPRRPAHRPQRARARRAARPADGARPALQPPHPAPQLRHPPADARGGPARDPGAARPREPQHHPALHPRRHPPPARGLQEGASAGVTPGGPGGAKPPGWRPDRPSGNEHRSSSRPGLSCRYGFACCLLPLDEGVPPPHAARRTWPFGTPGAPG